MTMTTIRVYVGAAALLIASAASATQQPAAPAKPGAPPAQAPKVEEAPPPPAAPAYTYDAAGRRDPFVSLVARGSDPSSNANRPAGLPGMSINEVSVKGTLHDRS